MQRDTRQYSTAQYVKNIVQIDQNYSYFFFFFFFFFLICETIM
jgi:hypothetical protein